MRKHVDAMTLSLGAPYSALGWELFPGNPNPKKKQKKRKVGGMGPPVKVSTPKKLLEGFETLK